MFRSNVSINANVSINGGTGEPLQKSNQPVVVSKGNRTNQRSFCLANRQDAGAPGTGELQSSSIAGKKINKPRRHNEHYAVFSSCRRGLFLMIRHYFGNFPDFAFRLAPGRSAKSRKRREDLPQSQKERQRTQRTPYFRANHVTPRNYSQITSSDAAMPRSVRILEVLVFLTGST